MSQWMVAKKQLMVIGLVPDPNSFPVPFHPYPVCNTALLHVHVVSTFLIVSHILGLSII